MLRGILVHGWRSYEKSITDSKQILKGNDGSTLISNCLPDHIDIEENNDTRVLCTAPETIDSILPLSTNAYSGACSSLIDAGTRIDYIDFEVTNADSTSVVNKINIWVVNGETNEVIEHLTKDEDKQVIFSTDRYAYVVRFKFETTYDVPTYFIVQCTRVNGVSIAYYYSQNPASGWLQGNIAPKVGDVITGNSTVIPIYTIYQYGDK